MLLEKQFLARYKFIYLFKNNTNKYIRYNCLVVPIAINQLLWECCITDTNVFACKKYITRKIGTARKCNPQYNCYELNFFILSHNSAFNRVYACWTFPSITYSLEMKGTIFCSDAAVMHNARTDLLPAWKRMWENSPSVAIPK